MKLFMKHAISFLLILFGFSSCAIIMESFKPKGFTYRYKAEYTGIDTLLNIDGYFLNDSSCKAVMFYRDGSAAVMEVVDEGDLLQENKNKYYYYPRWGSYRIEGDTIKAQIIYSYGGTRSIEAGFYCYIIKSRDSLEYFTRGYYTDSTAFKKKYVEETVNIPLIYHPYPGRMDSINWTKKHRWFWDKEAYKNRKKQ